MSDDTRDPTQPDARAQHRAARTTIVGGQPSGNSRPLPPIPVGLEHLLSLAAAHPEFAEALQQDRATALAASEVELNATEQAVFAAIDEASWTQMVTRVDAQRPAGDRRAFMAQATLAVALLLGGGAAACGPKSGKSSGPKPKPRDPRPLSETGVRPDRPMRPQQTRGIQPDRPRHEMTAPPTGIQPDRPRPRTEPNPQDARGTGARPDRPLRKRPNPRRPQPKTGSQPDRPPKPLAGARRHDDD